MIEKVPSPKALGAERFLRLSNWHSVQSLAAPLLYLVLFVAACYVNHWTTYLAAIVFGYLSFSRAFSVQHNLCHGSFRIPGSRKWLSDAMLVLYSMPWPYPGHAYLTAHKCHHKYRCGDPRDPEGVSGRRWWSALLFGPVWVGRVWLYGLVNAPSLRTGLLTGFEIVVLATLFVLSLYRLMTAEEYAWYDYGIMIYLGEAAFLLWVFPFFSGWVTHWACRPTLRGQAVNLPLWVWAILFGADRMHLMHHIFPTIHSDLLPAMAELPKVKEFLSGQDLEHAHEHGSDA